MVQKKCKNCKFFFLGYRKNGACEFCTAPLYMFRYGTVNVTTPNYKDIDQIDVARCNDYVFNPFSYFINILMLRFLKREIV